MNRLTIQTRLGLVFLAFVLLVLVSVAVTFWGLQTQNQDALLVNLAGRQRMLMQTITGLALAIDYDGYAPHASELERSRLAFEQTLAALQHGGPAPYTGDVQVTLPPPADPAIAAQLAQTAAAWQALAGPLDALASASPGSPELAAAVSAIQRAAPEVVAQADAAVRAYERLARQKLQRLRWIQGIFLLSALALLALGWWVTRRSVIAPLNQLDAAAARIGHGDLHSPVTAPAPPEMRVLGDTIEDMRGQLLISHQSLEAWAETLEQRVAQRTRQAEALAAVSREIASHLELTPLLQSVTETARELLTPPNGAGRERVTASLCLLDGAGQQLNLQAHAGDPQAVAQCETPVTPELAGFLFNPGADPEQRRLSACRDYCQVLAPNCRGSHLAAPLRAGERVTGALCLASPRLQAFPAESLDVLNQLAAAAAVGLENARLYGQAERAAALEERQRIAAEMHDGLLQTLSYVRLMALQAGDELQAGDTNEAAAALQRILRAEGQAQGEIRRAIASLEDDFPLRFTLQEQLAEITENFAREHAAELQAAGATLRWTNLVNRPLALPRQQGEQVLRAAREALSNALRHAAAHQIEVRLEPRRTAGAASAAAAAGESPAAVTSLDAAERLALVVQDDGCGFDPQALPADGRPHFGLKIIQARMQRLNGQARVFSPPATDHDAAQPESLPGQGTRLVLEWPAVDEPGSLE